MVSKEDAIWGTRDDQKIFKLSWQEKKKKKSQVKLQNPKISCETINQLL